RARTGTHDFDAGYVRARGHFWPDRFSDCPDSAGLVRPGYDPVTTYASDLAVGEASWLQTANFIVFGCLVILFAVGLGRGLAGGRALRLSVMLLALTGLGLIIAGVFPTDLIGQPSTNHGAMHFVASILMFGPPEDVF